MTRELIVRPAAEKEIRDAFDWYEQHVPGLGSNFLLNLDAIFEALLQNPQQFPLVYKNLRRALIRRFPYQIMYLVDGQRVVVVAVSHARRSPKRWMKRGT